MVSHIVFIIMKTDAIIPRPHYLNKIIPYINRGIITLRDYAPNTLKGIKMVSLRQFMMENH